MEKLAVLSLYSQFQLNNKTRNELNLDRIKGKSKSNNCINRRRVVVAKRKRGGKESQQRGDDQRGGAKERVEAKHDTVARIRLKEDTKANKRCVDDSAGVESVAEQEKES